MISFKLKFQVVVALAGLVSICSSLPGHAQKSRIAVPAQASKAAAEEAKFTPAQRYALAEKRKKWLLAQRAESGGTGEGAWQLIHRPMDLPNLPPYTGTGATFVEGLMYPNKPGGAAISLTYRAKETPDVVMAWYEEALTNYHWKMGKTKADNGAVTAVNGDNGVSILTQPSKAKGYKSDIKITFKLAHK